MAPGRAMGLELGACDPQGITGPWLSPRAETAGGNGNRFPASGQASVQQFFV